MRRAIRRETASGIWDGRGDLGPVLALTAFEPKAEGLGGRAMARLSRGCRVFRPALHSAYRFVGADRRAAACDDQSS